MKPASLLVLLIATASPAVHANANDFPTTERVEYVIECMRDHAGKYEYLYKCSCVIDHIAGELGYDEYVEISTALRQKSLGGERGAVFRDTDIIKVMAKKYQAIEDASSKACLVR
jgi:hypothetical protein